MPSSKSFKQISLFTLSSAIVASLASAVAAAPHIEQAYRSSDGEMIIEGIGFGGGPTVVLHDDFSNAEFSGDEVVFHPEVGDWYKARATSSSKSLYLDTKNNRKSLYVRGDGYAKLEFGVPDSSGPYGRKTFQEVYFSYTIKDLGEFPGAGGGLEEFSTVSSTKDAWMMFGSKGHNTAYAVSSGEPAGNDLYIPGWTGGGFTIHGNNSKLYPKFWQGELTKNWDFGGWNTKMFHAELDPDDPYGPAEGFFSFLNENAYHVNTRDGNFMGDLRSQGVPYAVWDRIKFFAWLNEDDADVNRILDEVYVAIGENANARLIISDAASLETSSRVFHLSPTRWTDYKIVANFPDYLPDGNAYFLHVADSKNSFSKGFALCQRCPTAPSAPGVE